MNTKYIKQFEKYYNGEMDPEEKGSFEESLSQNPELNADYQEYLSIYEAIGDQETLDLRVKLKELRNEWNRNSNGADFIMNSRNWLWLAALITVIISFTVIVSLLITKADWKDQTASEIKSVEINDFSALNRELIKFKQRKTNFMLESPKNSVFHNRKDPILFQWTVDSTNLLILDLIDWEGKIVFSSGTAVVSPYLVKKKLPEGILVYRFRSETESYYLGFLLLK
ncbi:MAG: hypothetical protein M0Q51_07780 [Bacteroidales bacterium]|nr:hypothetical protein [Bacteroidales bacterium]